VRLRQNWHLLYCHILTCFVETGPQVKNYAKNKFSPIHNLFYQAMNTTSKNIIEAKNVFKTYGDSATNAVSGVSFSVPYGVCFGMLGPNGAGKSTMMKMIYGVCLRDKKENSDIKVFGHDPGVNALPIRFLSGIVPQEDNLDEELNVEQNLKVFCKFYDIRGEQADKRIAELLSFMELSEKQHHGIKQLSGGMKRRLIIARALLNNPRLLILDEPTTGLDPQVRHLIWDKLRHLKREGMTILLTTHYMDEAFQICDTVFIMDKGKSVAEGEPQELVNKHIEPYVCEIYSRESFSIISKDAAGKCCRVDESGDVVRIYSNDYEKLREFSKHLHVKDFNLRQSNLEDLFLKITGSRLNAQQ